MPEVQNNGINHSCSVILEGGQIHSFSLKCIVGCKDHRVCYRLLVVASVHSNMPLLKTQCGLIGHPWHPSFVHLSIRRIFVRDQYLLLAVACCKIEQTAVFYTYLSDVVWKQKFELVL
jgi:hypothetical protein